MYGERILGRLVALEQGIPKKKKGLPKTADLRATLSDPQQWQISRWGRSAPGWSCPTLAVV